MEIYPNKIGNLNHLQNYLHAHRKTIIDFQIFFTLFDKKLILSLIFIWDSIYNIIH